MVDSAEGFPTLHQLCLGYVLAVPLMSCVIRIVVIRTEFIEADYSMKVVYFVSARLTVMIPQFLYAFW